MNNSQDISIFFDDSSPHLLETGIPQTLEQYNSLLLDLFQKLRTAGMLLTLDQYNLLQKAVDKGYGLSGWEDLERLCRLLWVKPCPNYDVDVFDKVFNEFRHQHLPKTPVETKPEPREKTPPTSTDSPAPPEERSSNLLEVPPRKWELQPTQESGKIKTPSAIEGSSTSQEFNKYNKQDFVFTPTDFPIKLRDIQSIWRLLKKPVRVGRDLELDIEATVERIGQEGFFADVVMRPVMTRKAELLLLIDDSSAMIPFFPAFEPFIRAIEEHRITPARIYRFTSYPDEDRQYLYEWKRPTRAHLLIEILPKLHRNRTITLILSDAGAAKTTYDDNQIQGTLKFLNALSPCIRKLIWLNPLPSEYWKYTSAWGIHGILNGEMLTYEVASLQNKAKEDPQGNMIKICQI